jgi:signal transduction histidine kinase
VDENAGVPSRSAAASAGRRAGGAAIRRRWVLLILATASIGWALGGEYLSIHHGVYENHFLDALVGLSFFGGGIVALDRRPGNLVGPLMIAYAAIWFLGNWGNLHSWPFYTLGFVGGTLSTPILAHLFLVYPGGRVRTRADRGFLWAVYVSSIGEAIALALTWDPHAFGCTRCPSSHAAWPSLDAFHVIQRVQVGVAIVLVPWFLAAIFDRWRRGSPAERRDLVPMWAAACLLSTVYLVGVVASPDPRDRFSYLLSEIRALLEVVAPVLFVWGLLSTKLARSAVSDLVLELDRSLAPGDLHARLARYLGDPTLDLVYALDRGRRWVSVDGRSVSIPTATEEGGRSVTLIERDGEPLAALIHDPALDEGLVRAAGAAAGMSIENERLHAEVRAQLEEVRASRQRIVEAGDRERRRIERNLHDGAQQRLVFLSLALGVIRDRDGVDPTTANDLGEASALLREALGELRELASGIHPAILSEEGLVAAVHSLADGSSIPVLVQADIDGLAPSVEATAYFVVSEALANVAKYANASSAAVVITCRGGRLRVEVSDDGIGGADPRRGTGLRGLEDRVATVGGTVTVHSPSGSGTLIVAEMPIDA